MKLLRCFLVERILWVGLQEEVLEAIHDGVDCEYRFPVLSQDIETNVAIQVNVRMVHFVLALYLGWLVRVGGSNLETK